jgi:hypothetical protein
MTKVTKVKYRIQKNRGNVQRFLGEREEGEEILRAS